MPSADSRYLRSPDTAFLSPELVGLVDQQPAGSASQARAVLHDQRDGAPRQPGPTSANPNAGTVIREQTNIKQVLDRA